MFWLHIPKLNLFGLVSDIHGQYWTMPTNLAIKT